MTIIVCRPVPEDADNLPAIQSHLTKFHPHVIVEAGEGSLTLEHAASLETDLRRAFLAASLTVRFAARTADFRHDIWERLLR